GAAASDLVKDDMVSELAPDQLVPVHAQTIPAHCFPHACAYSVEISHPWAEPTRQAGTAPLAASPHCSLRGRRQANTAHFWTRGGRVRSVSVLAPAAPRMPALAGGGTPGLVLHPTRRYTWPIQRQGRAARTACREEQHARDRARPGAERRT